MYEKKILLTKKKVHKCNWDGVRVSSCMRTKVRVHSYLFDASIYELTLEYLIYSKG